MKLWPFTVIEGPAGKPIIEVTFKGELKKFVPEEISSMVLMKMKEIAEAYLGREAKNAVITVPARFNTFQRQATVDAGVISGFNVLGIINEPTAAAIAYSFHEKRADARNVLIFDLGGGTFDVSLVTIDDGIFEVRATAGDTHLGGEDFDSRLVQYFTTEFKRKFREDMTQNHRALRRLRTACERAKRTLSSSTHANIEIDSLYEDIDFNTVITRALFEDLNMDYFRKCIEPVEKVLKDSTISKADVHEIILVGGSTRIPKVQELLSDFFDGKELNKTINPDEAVAVGATAMAAFLCQGRQPYFSKDLLVNESNPFSIGIEGANGVMTTFIRGNKMLPAKKSETLYTLESSVLLKVFEGDSSLSKDNQLLGELLFDGITPIPNSTAQIDVTIDYFLDSVLTTVLTVSAVEKSTGKERMITISGGMSVDEIERLRRVAKRYQSEDEADRVRFAAKNALEDYTIQVRDLIKNKIIASKVSEKEKKMLDDAVIVTTQWSECNQEAEYEEFVEKQKALEAQVASTLSTVGSRIGGASFRSC
jgi:heat shock 70kDa protein 1/2/6/8